MSTGNHMIDGDDGSHSSSPSFIDLPACPSCGGSGLNEEDDGEDCTRCLGEGVITLEEHREYYLD